MLKSILVTFSIILLLSGCTQRTAEEELFLAKESLENDDIQAAYVSLKSAIQKDPSLSEARFILGGVLFSAGEFLAAEKELTRALDMRHDIDETLSLLSLSYQVSGASVALAEMELYPESVSSDTYLKIGYRKALALITLNNFDNARNLINSLPLSTHISEYTHLAKSLESIIDKNNSRALELATRASEVSEGNSVDVFNLLGWLNLINGKPIDAAQAYESYLQLVPQDLRIRFILSSLLVDIGETLRAEPYIDDLLILESQNSTLNYLKAIVRYAQSDWEAALKFSKTAIFNGSTNQSLRLIAGYSAYQLRDFKEAAYNLNFVAKNLPNNHPALVVLTAAKVQLGKGEEATAFLSRLDDLAPENIALYTLIGMDLLETGDTVAAEEVIEFIDAVNASPEDLIRLGLLKLSLDRPDGIVNLEEALRDIPDSINARQALAYAYIKTNQLEKVEKLAKEWQASFPDSIEGLLLQAEIELINRNLEAASKILDLASMNEANSIALKLLKAQFYDATNDFESAIKHAESVLEQEPANVRALSLVFKLNKKYKQPVDLMKHVNEGISKSPDDINLQMLAANFYAQLGKMQSVVDTLSNIENSNNLPSDYWILKGNALIALNKISDAYKHFDEWSIINPKQEKAVLGKLLILDTNKDYQRGLNVAERFLRGKENLQVSLFRTHFLVMLARYGDAKQIINNYDKQLKELPFLQGIEARILMAEGKIAAAIPKALRNYNANPTITNAVLAVEIFNLQNDFEGGNHFLSEHIIKFPKDVRAKMLLAERHLKRKPSSAIPYYESLVSEHPENGVALNNLAFLLMNEGKLERAEQFAKKAIEIRPDSISTINTYAQIAFKAGNKTKALEIYKTTDVERILNEEVLINYVEVLIANAEYPEALKILYQTTFESEDSLKRVEEIKSRLSS